MTPEHPEVVGNGARRLRRFNLGTPLRYRSGLKPAEAHGYHRSLAPRDGENRVWRFWSRRDRSRLAEGFNLGFPAPETVQVPKGRLKFIPTNIADRIPRGGSSAKPGTPPETSSFDSAPPGS